ncbi:hypothetical protein ACIBG7_19315 [Nonomuraea sp. NPDC050328]|uniref:hypothetical protein n=1 Tax=Nonomuraea sp. NPDC050328 TaxID=3364361 RepID=UPI0037A98C3F
MDELGAVRDLLAAGPPAPEVVRAGRARLTALSSHEPVRRSRRAAWWSTIALGVAGAAAATALVLGTSPQPVSVQHVLAAAATRVERLPDEGAWWGATVISRSRGRVSTQETWIPADPEGKTWHRRTTGGRSETFSTDDWDFRIVLAGRPLTKTSGVPDTPEGLQALLGGPGLLDNVARLLVHAPVTSETRAAAYRLLSGLPGVVAVGEVTDPLGRPGQAVEYDSAELGGRARLVIDPATGAPLALETRADGVTTDYTAIQNTRWAEDNPLDTSLEEQE